MTAAIAIALIFAAGIAAFWTVGIWRWFLAAFAVFLGAWELISIKIEDLSLSQSFWEFHKANPVHGWLLWGFLVAVCAIWLGHMIWPKIRRKR